MERISLIWWQEGSYKILWKEMEVSHHAELDLKMTERGDLDVDLMGVSCGAETVRRSRCSNFRR